MTAVVTTHVHLACPEARRFSLPQARFRGRAAKAPSAVRNLPPGRGPGYVFETRLSPCPLPSLWLCHDRGGGVSGCGVTAGRAPFPAFVASILGGPHVPTRL